MADIVLRERVRKMRSSGEGIGAIAEQLGVSKSTVSYWCRDIHLTKRQQMALAARWRAAGAIGRLRAAEQKRSARMAQTAQLSSLGAADVASLSPRDIRMIGLALYWGEGYKNGNDECGITNSDPGIIRAFMRWVQEAYGVMPESFIARISVNEIHRARIQEIERHWTRVTGIPQTQFTKPSFIRATAHKTYTNTNEHFGTLRVKVRRGTALRRRILGSLEKLREDFTRGTGTP